MQAKARAKAKAKANAVAAMEVAHFRAAGTERAGERARNRLAELVPLKRICRLRDDWGSTVRYLQLLIFLNKLTLSVGLSN